MKAVCDTCGARYRIPDEKAAGKVLQIRCRKCGNVFKFEGSSSPSPAKAPKGDWFFAIDGESFGPYTQRELRTRFETGKLGLNTHVWKEGFSDWLPVGEHPEFAAAIELSKDNIRRLGAQSPQSSSATDGSGRFTVDIRRPGATVDDRTDAQRDALNDEVDDAFKSLLGQSANDDDPSDEFTPTKPMRVRSAAEKLAAEEPEAETIESTRPVSQPADAPSRPEPSKDVTTASAQPKPKAAKPPAKPATKPSDKRLSLSERLRLIREQSEGGAATKPSETPAQAELPAHQPSTPAETTPEPLDEAPDAASAEDAKGGELFDGLDAVRDAQETPLPGDLKAVDIPASKEPVAPIPSGPIRQVTQELDVSDFFGADAQDSPPVQREAAPAVDVPSDEDLQAHLSKRKLARARGETPPPVSTDEPPFILPGDLPKESSARPQSVSSPYRLDGTADDYDDEPPYILDDPTTTATKDARITEHDITPVGGTAAVSTPAPTSSHPRVEPPVNDRRRLLIIILILSLLLLLLLAGWLFLRGSGDTTDAHSTLEDVVEVDTPPAVDLTDVLYARNRAIGIVAQSRSAAKTAAFVATEDQRNAEQQARLRPSGSTRSARPSNNSMRDIPIDFTTASTSSGRLGAQRSAASTGPSKALFADALRGTVARTVGRCAQRTLGVQGYLPVARLELSITINPDGTVSRVRGQRQAHGGPLMKCITNESQRWKFPEFSGKATTISNAYVLQ